MEVALVLALTGAATGYLGIVKKQLMKWSTGHSEKKAGDSHGDKIL